MKKVLLTGASGFIGKNVLLQKPGYWGVTAVSMTHDLEPFIRSKDIKNVVCHRIDLCDKVAPKKIYGSYDIVIWLAANGDPSLSVSSPGEDLMKNAYMLVNVLNHIDADVFVYFSSGAVYNGIDGEVTLESKLDPTLPYAISKLAAEQYIKHFAKEGRIGNCQIVRFFGAYGPHEAQRKIYNKLVRAFGINRDRKFTIKGDGNNYIDAMYVEDAVSGVVSIAENAETHKLFDFYMGNRTTVNELVLNVAKTFGLDGVQIAHEGFVSEYIKFTPTSDYMRDVIGWKPKYSLKDGMIKFRDYLLGENREEEEVF